MHIVNGVLVFIFASFSVFIGYKGSKVKDLIIEMNRFYSDREATQGIMRFGDCFPVYTLEDEKRDVKVMNETRIPRGRYEIKLRDAGGMNERYKDRFPNHRGMLHLQDVPNFEWVYIHIGNHDDQTSGCILVGEGENSAMTVSRSTEAYNRVYAKCLETFNAGGKVYILISDEPALCPDSL